MNTPNMNRLYTAAAAAIVALAVAACGNPNDPMQLGTAADQPTVVVSLVGVWSQNDGSTHSYWEFDDEGASNYEELLSTGEQVSWNHYGGWEVEEQAGGEENILFNVLIDGFDGTLEYDAENDVLSGDGSGYKRTPLF